MVYGICGNLVPIATSIVTVLAIGSNILIDISRRLIRVHGVVKKMSST